MSGSNEKRTAWIIGFLKNSLYCVDKLFFQFLWAVGECKYIEVRNQRTSTIRQISSWSCVLAECHCCGKQWVSSFSPVLEDSAGEGNIGRQGVLLPNVHPEASFCLFLVHFSIANYFYWIIPEWTDATVLAFHNHVLAESHPRMAVMQILKVGFLHCSDYCGKNKQTKNYK